MKMTIHEKGKYAEQLALHYLEAQGLSLVEQNFTVRGGEIDLVMRNDDTLVFVEVRAKAPGALVHPFESITPTKQKRIQFAAQIFLLKRKAHHFYLRFDVIGVNLLNNQIDWLQNAF